MSWLKLIVSVLQIGEMLLDWSIKQGYIKEGETREIGKQSAKILLKTQFAKEVRIEVSRLGDAELDDVLRNLEEK